MSVYTGYELAAIAKYVKIAEDDLWKYLNRAVENGQVEQYYSTDDAAAYGNDYDSEYVFNKFSATQFLAIIPTTE